MKTKAIIGILTTAVTLIEAASELIKALNEKSDK